MTRRVWEINFMVTGPVLLEKNHIQIIQEKGFDMDQFYSNVSLKKTSYGFDAAITAYADDSETAVTVGYVFFWKNDKYIIIKLEYSFRDRFSFK